MGRKGSQGREGGSRRGRALVASSIGNLNFGGKTWPGKTWPGSMPRPTSYPNPIP